ncbi:S-layer homology domain-containing protein [Paenibacillus dakarensis]|uniref:S-layer homology domain-containing protein n=1 Tax=Paenibacillus dakarensis TaxID=1527293 RepID=UPI0006D56901|nr:S-layer homology domain-containing protein [Paenibacillus dakarensis]
MKSSTVLRRKWKEYISCLCILTILCGFFPVPALAASEDTALQPGEIALDKTATKVEGTDNEWEITLTAEGANHNIGVASDVVLVMDKSGSMQDNDKFEKAQEAAKLLVNKLLAEGSQSRVALVTFDSEAGVANSDSPFYGADQLDGIIQKLNTIKRPNGGTNIQEGIYAARTILSQSSSENKVIVLLSDGAPTYSFPASNAEAYSWPDGKYDFTLSNFNYDHSARIGDGSHYELKTDYWHNEEYPVGEYVVKDNGIATLSEAKLAADAGIKTFSVGLSVPAGGDAEYVLKNSAVADGYHSAEPEELNEVFSAIASKILSAARDSYVIDPVGEMFNLKLENNQLAGYIADPDRVTLTSSDNSETLDTIRWDIGDLKEGHTATLTYTVSMDLSKFPNLFEDYPTNKTTTLFYKDVNNNDATKDFPIPTANYGKGSIIIKGYKANAQGQPLKGTEVVANWEDADILYHDYMKVNDKPGLEIGNTYEVSVPVVDGYKHVPLDSDKKEVTLTQDHPYETIYFAFTQSQKLTVKHMADGEAIIAPTVTHEAIGADISAAVSQDVLKMGYAYSNVTITPEDALKADDKGNVTGQMPETEVTITYNYVKEHTFTVQHMANGKPIIDSTVTNKPIGAEISEAVSQEVLDKGYIFDNVTIEPENALKADDKGNVTGQMPAGEVTVTYNYTKVYDFTVKHMAGDEELATSTVSKLPEGKDISAAVSQDVLDQGYAYINVTIDPEDTVLNVDEEGNVTGNMPAGEVTVTFNYVKKQTLTVQHVANGQPIIKPEVSNLPPGTDISAAVSQEVLDQGYIFDNVTIEPEGALNIDEHSNVSGKMPAAGVIVTYNYTKVYDFTVKHMDGDKELATPAVSQLPEGKDISAAVSQDVLDQGYAYINVTIDPEDTALTVDEEGNVTGNMPANAVTVTFNYVKKQTLTVQHVANGQPIIKPEVSNLPPGTDISAAVSQEVLDQGYIFDNVTIEPEGALNIDEHSNVSGKMPAAGVIVTYNYTKVYDFTVKHMDGDKELATPAVSQLPEGKEITTAVSQEVLDQGYIFSGVTITPEKALNADDKGNVTGNMPANAVTVTYNYTKVYDFTVKHMDGDEELATPAVSQLPEGEDITAAISQEVLDQGYIFNNVTITPENVLNIDENSNVSGQMPAEAVTITYNYTVKPVLNKEDHYDYISGYPDGTVRPENEITREEVAAIFYRLLEETSRDALYDTTNPFSDMKVTNWSNKHVSTLENGGILSGYKDGTFRPTHSITRAEFAVIAARFDDLDLTENTMFSDISGHWAEKYIASSANKGWIKGYPDGTFKPNEYITRAEAMCLINNVLNRKVTEEGVLADTKPWPDNTKDKWYYYDVIEATHHHIYTRNEDGTETWVEIKPDYEYRNMK